MALLSLRNVSLSFAGPPLLDQLSLHIEHGERICLLGRNGTGKSTLLRVVAGTVTPDEGLVESSKGLRVAVLAQEVPDADDGLTVAEMVGSGVDAAVAEMPRKHAVDTVCSRLSLDAEALFATLSAGWKRRVLLGRALASEPDLLLLDEPTNHLDIPAIDWLESFLLRHVPTMLFVSHDRAFVRKLASRVIELDRGMLYSFPGSYDEYERRKAEALAAEDVQNAAFDKKLAKEEAWLRTGIKARRTRNEGRVRALKRLREQRSARRQRIGQARMQIQRAERSGKLVAEADGVVVELGGKRILDGFSSVVLRGDRLGIIGPNGCGKTTLLRTLLGELKPTEGSVKLGTRLQIAYFDQLRDQLDVDASVADNVAEGSEQVMVDGAQRHVLGYLESFLFAPERSRTPVRALSGGERNRLLLAKLFLKPSNIMVLDEPTNDLDVETLELLEQLLVDYAGTVLVVSHDRAFLNNVVTSTLAFEEGGRFGEYPGGYDDWQEQSRAAAVTGQAATAPPKDTPAFGKKGKPKTAAKVKLTFKQNKELAALPARIEALESEQAEIHQQLADPSFYQSAGDAIAAATDRLAALQDELASAYTAWEELEAIADASAAP